MSETGKTPPKNARAEALEKALRENLRRRKAAVKDAPAPPAATVPDIHEKASGKGDTGA